MRKFARLILRLTLIGAGFGLAACDEREVASRLDFARSTEMMVALGHAGIAAERTRESSGTQATFTITVDDSQFNQALEVVQAYGLSNPRTAADEREATVGEGFLPQARELTLLEYDRRVAAQLERLLRGYEGVIDARAIVRGANESDSSQPNGSGGARVTLLLRYNSSSGKAPLTEEQLKQLVTGVVPGAKPDTIVLTMERVNFSSSTVGRDPSNKEVGEFAAMERLSPLGFRVLSVERTRAQQQLAGVVVIVAVSALVIGIYAGWSMSSRSLRRRLSKRAVEAPSDNFFGEAGAAATEAKSDAEREPGSVLGRASEANN